MTKIFPWSRITFVTEIFQEISSWWEKTSFSYFRSCVLKASVGRVSTDTIGRHIDWHRVPLDRHACQTILGRQAADTSPTLGQYFTDTWPTLYRHLVSSCYWVLFLYSNIKLFFSSPLKGTFGGLRPFLTFQATFIYVKDRFFSLCFSFVSSSLLHNANWLRSKTTKGLKRLLLSTCSDLKLH